MGLKQGKQNKPRSCPESQVNCELVVIHILERKVICATLSLENNFADVLTECSSWHPLMTTRDSVETSAKLFSELKLTTDNLSLHLCSSQLEATE